jgi:hypothetical protein
VVLITPRRYESGVAGALTAPEQAALVDKAGQLQREGTAR